jgi:hypothetical protein
LEGDQVVKSVFMFIERFDNLFTMLHRIAVERGI